MTDDQQREREAAPNERLGRIERVLRQNIQRCTIGLDDARWLLDQLAAAHEARAAAEQRATAYRQAWESLLPELNIVRLPDGSMVAQIPLVRWSGACGRILAAPPAGQPSAPAQPRADHPFEPCCVGPDLHEDGDEVCKFGYPWCSLPRDQHPPAVGQGGEPADGA